MATRPPTPLVVKKYGNRRLYDTAESRYITLEELAEKIQRGADVRVVDAKTNEDLTQSTLTQILMEGRGMAQFLSVPLLTQLVRMGDDALADFLGRYLAGALELYLQMRQGAQAISPLNPFANVPFAASNAFARLLSQMAGWPGMAPQPVPAWPAAPAPQAWVAPPPAHPPEAAPPTPPPANDVDAIRREIEELKRALREQAPAPAPRGKKGR